MASLESHRPLPVENVAEFLRQHHGRNVLHAYRSVQKFYFRLESIKRDLIFLKACRSNNVIPKFLWFKTANRQLAQSYVYKDCQRRFLRVEIDWKYDYFYRTKSVHELSLDVLRELISNRLFEHLHRMVILSSSRLLQEKENKLKYKLWDLGVRKEYIEVNDPGVVTNLSSRVLSDEEIQCLANGLDDGLIPKRIDRLNIASNVEQFYHRVTDITQHHKEFMNELKEHGGIVNTDVRVLNPKELTLVSDLRSLTQSFLHKADQFRQQNLKIESKEQNYRTILKNLREDNSIVITRPDKGRGIVLMDRQEYVNKMLFILDDSSKFCCLSEDPTIKREKYLNDLLRRLLNEGSVTDEFHRIARPIGFNPGRLYGLPKVPRKTYHFDQYSRQLGRSIMDLERLLLTCCGTL